ncbi:hypothetical protein FNV82_06260 [Chlorobium phaeovibrioides]|nr:hypothetical protein FNV82_06260 [Chlorobium phaeovibrioides]
MTNFYFIVLMTGAERLKIAYILLVYAALLPGKLAYLLAFASPFAHLQSLLLLASLGLARYSRPLQYALIKHRIRRKYLMRVVPIVIISSLIFFYFIGAVVRKASGYMALYGGLSDVFMILFLLLLAWQVTVDRFRMGVALSPLVVGAYFLGDDRVNMIAFTLTMYLLLIEGRISHPLVLLLLVYFSVKSIPFVYNILAHGNGFDGFLF